MSTFDSSLSDEVLSVLIGQTKDTIRRPEISTGKVRERVRNFYRLYSNLSVEPSGGILLYQEPNLVPACCALSGQKLVVGRLPKSVRNPGGSDLAFDDYTMSRQHFEIDCAEGFYVVRDLGSQNGTYLNDDPQRINESVLKAGDMIHAGEMAFIFAGE